jgi:hypothetical protein
MLIRYLTGCIADVTLKYFQENGFSYPILVRKKEGLGIRLVYRLIYLPTLLVFWMLKLHFTV